MAVLLWWARARVDHWAGRLLLNAPTDDVVLHAKFLQEIEANNQQGRKFWAISLSFITLSLMGFWDAILATLQFVVVPFALMTHSREQFGKLGWLVYYMLLGLLYFRLHWLNHALGKVKDSNGQMFFWLLLVHSWNEFSTSRFSTMALKNLAMLAAVWLQPISRGVVLASWFSLISMALFCYRRRWNTSVCDGMAALVTRQELDQSRQEATLLRTLFHSKSVFLRTLCHELRNPMTAVQGNNEILVRMLSQAIKRGQPRAPRTPDLHCPAPRRTDSSPSTEAECDRLRARVRELEALLASPGEAPGEAGELDLYHELYGELPKMLRFSSNALLSAKHMSDVLNQTLTAAKLESEQGDVGSMPDEDVVCVRECFETATSMFQIVADQKGVELRLVLPAEEGDLVVKTHASCLKQSIINLLGNALKFTETGSIVISARVLVTAGKLTCSVADTGIGMTTDEQQRLFSPFSQANSSIEQQYGGSGLGLHIVRQSLQQVGGTIGVESAKHKGSTFTFELPVAVALGDSEPAASGSEEAIATTLDSAPRRPRRPSREETDTASLRQRTEFGVRLEDIVESGKTAPTNLAQRRHRRRSRSVLIVDDDVGVLEVLREQLGSVLDCTVTAAANGAEAVARTQEQQFDLIIMDINMPVLDGLGATRAIRAESVKNGSTPIVGFSGNSLEADLQLAEAAGMDTYLTKPYKLAELCEVISQYTDTATQQVQTGPPQATVSLFDSCGLTQRLHLPASALIGAS
eukprot:TRINITY_DN2253_c0_g2_i9.p1 TRINITY_DN2253_c0_g2~~TRINITY_DN2253_c0_g2_i9.p1  ORF type:complete len:751 (+),score=174.38 TRINITY_DN2253_c0_g2_i9:143-2395(+)